MNFSQSSSIETENDCIPLIIKTVPLRLSATDSVSYGSLITTAVLSLATCPFTILLNALVIVAVKTKRRLQTHPNILLACMALTDLTTGLVVQPLYVTKTVFLLQGKGFHEFCDIHLTSSVFHAICAFTSLLHSVLISAERYLAIKHTFTHASVVTKTRLMVSSAVAWIAAGLILLVSWYSVPLIFWSFAPIVAAVVVLQLLVYKEARQHEKQILSQQISLEARAKFEKDKKALKLTTIILSSIFLCLFVPFIGMYFTWKLFDKYFSPEVKTTVRHFSLLLLTLNSVLNPVIYSVRLRQFRVAFIELLLRKSFQEAEEFERTLFGARHDNGRPGDGREDDQQEQNAEASRNPTQANQGQQQGPTVFISGANFDESNTASGQNEPGTSNVLGRSTFKTAQGEHGERTNPPSTKENEADKNEVFVLGENVYDSNTAAAQNEPVSSNTLDCTFEKAKKEHYERTYSSAAKENEEEVFVLEANGHYSNAAVVLNEPVSSIALGVKFKKTDEEHWKRTHPVPVMENEEDHHEITVPGAIVALSSTFKKELLRGTSSPRAHRTRKKRRMKYIRSLLGANFKTNAIAAASSRNFRQQHFQKNEEPQHLTNLKKKLNNELIDNNSSECEIEVLKSSR